MHIIDNQTACIADSLQMIDMTSDDHANNIRQHPRSCRHRLILQAAAAAASSANQLTCLLAGHSVHVRASGQGARAASSSNTHCWLPSPLQVRTYSLHSWPHMGLHAVSVLHLLPNFTTLCRMRQIICTAYLVCCSRSAAVVLFVAVATLPMSGTAVCLHPW